MATILVDSCSLADEHRYFTEARFDVRACAALETSLLVKLKLSPFAGFMQFFLRDSGLDFHSCKLIEMSHRAL
jgi:hypothetical protein